MAFLKIICFSEIFVIKFNYHQVMIIIISDGGDEAFELVDLVVASLVAMIQILTRVKVELSTA